MASAIVGLIVGSALTALIHRLSRGGSWIRGRSHCPRCAHALKPRDLVPLFSYIALRGRCRYCTGPIGAFYPFIELVTAALFAAVVLIRAGGVPADGILDTPALQMLILRDWAAVAFCITIFGIDQIAGVIPDIISLPAAAVFLAWNLLLGYPAVPLIVGIFVGASFFAAQYWLSRGRWIGGGDIRLGGAIGALVGFPAVVLAIGIAYGFGALVSIGLLARGRATMKSHIPFGTFLTVGALLALLAGDQIISRYVAWIS